jgi:hypothetical protein
LACDNPAKRYSRLCVGTQLIADILELRLQHPPTPNRNTDMAFFISDSASLIQGAWRRFPEISSILSTQDIMQC